MPIQNPNNISSQVIIATSSNNMLDDGVGNYWFHHKPSFLNLNPCLYESIINNASSSINIWDPYFHFDNNHPDYLIFNNINDNITLKILTSKGLEGVRASYLVDVYNCFKTQIPSSKNMNFCIGAINKKYKKDWDFHDRFLIIDNVIVYIIGASVEYNHVSIKSSGIFKVSNVNSSNFIINLFNKHWGETEKFPSNVPQLLHL
jgi:hypothetical protein